MDSMIFLLAGGLLLAVIGLPLAALWRTRRIGQLEQRVAGLEAALLRVTRRLAEETAAPPPPRPEEAPAPAPAPAGSAEPAVGHSPPPIPSLPPERPLEELIGERWLGWAGVAVLLFGAAFALKYAFENRWIDELGRVAIGLATGVFFLWLGWRRHVAGWRNFAQALTAGGVTLLYLSAYAAHGFYQLLSAGTAFFFLALLAAQAHLLAAAYRAPAIAWMGQIGGYLTPVLLASDRDVYAALFVWLALLAGGAVLVSLLRGWQWIALASLGAAHLLFWVWHDGNYHPEKLMAALVFHLALFWVFFAADFSRWARAEWTAENWIRAYSNPFLFFAALYVLVEPERPGWMGAIALALALVYAAAARQLLTAGRKLRTAGAAGASLVFVTLAVPVQLESNWIALAWGAQGAALAWTAARLGSRGLRIGAAAVFALALSRHLLVDLPWGSAADFQPVLNRDFLAAFALAALLGFAARLPGSQAARLGFALAALVLTWLTMSLEIGRYTDSLVRAADPADAAARRSIEWAGGMALSLLWSLYAAALVGAGLYRDTAALRWAGLALFGVTVAKAFLFDIPMLDGFYRFVALLGLGLLLLAAGWAYQRLARPKGEPA